MGGNSSKEKVRVLNQNVILVQERHNIEALDKTFKSAFIASTDIEMIRCEFIPLWNEFLKLSGGIVIRHPRFDSCIKAMFWKFACDLNGQINIIELSEHEPFIRFKDVTIALPDDINLARSFSELMTYVYRNDDRVHMVASEMLKRMNRISDITKDSEKLLTTFRIPEIDINSHKNKIGLNYRRLAIANNIIVTIKTIFHHAKHGLHDFIDRINYPEEVRKMQNVGLEARKKNVTTATKIVFKYSMESKLDAYEDFNDLIDEDKQAEKAARFYLANLTKKMDEKMNKSLNYSANNSTIIVKDDVNKNTNINIDVKIDEASSCDEQSESDCQSEIDNAMIRKQALINGQNENIKIVNFEANPEPVFISHDEFKENIANNIKINIHEENDNVKISNIDKSSKVEFLAKQLEELQRNNESLMARLTTFDHDGNDIINSSQVDPHIPTENKIVVVSSVPKHSSRSKITTIPSMNNLNNIVIGNNFNATPEIHNNLTWDIKQRFTTKASIQSAFHSIVFAKSDNFDYLIGGNELGFIQIYSYPDLHEIKSFKVHTGNINCLLFLEGSKTLISGGNDGMIFVHDLSNLTSKNVATLNEPITAFANPLNGRSIFAAYGKSFIELDFLSYTNIFQLGAHNARINAMIYSREKDVLITCSDDTLIKIWDPISKENIGALEGHTAAIKGLSIGLVGNHVYLASAGEDKVITFWNLDDKDLTISFETEGVARNLFYLPERQGFCTIHDNGVFFLWKVEKRENIKFVHDLPIITGFGVEGRGIVFGAENGSILLWD